MSKAEKEKEKKNSEHESHWPLAVIICTNAVKNYTNSMIHRVKSRIV